jgi:hypothetical protein
MGVCAIQKPYIWQLEAQNGDHAIKTPDPCFGDCEFAPHRPPQHHSYAADLLRLFHSSSSFTTGVYERYLFSQDIHNPMNCGSTIRYLAV